MKLAQYFSMIPRTERKGFITLMSEKLDKSAVSIRSYINGNRRIQAQDVQVIENFTHKVVTKHDLRPDIFPLEDKAA